MSNLILDEILRKHFKEPFNSTHARWNSTPLDSTVSDYWKAYSKYTKLNIDESYDENVVAVYNDLKKYVTTFIQCNEYRRLFLTTEEIAFRVSINSKETNSSLINGIKRQYISEEINDDPPILYMHIYKNGNDTKLDIRLYMPEFGTFGTEGNERYELRISPGFSSGSVICYQCTQHDILTLKVDDIKRQFEKYVAIVRQMSTVIREYAKEQLEFMRLEKKIENDYREAMIDLKERSHKYISKFIKKGEILNSNSNYTCED